MEEVIRELGAKIASLEIDNAILRVQLRQMNEELEKLKEEVEEVTEDGEDSESSFRD